MSSQRSTLVYVYGALQPTLRAAEVYRQVTLGHWYYDRLVRCERIRRYAIRDATEGLSEQAREGLDYEPFNTEFKRRAKAEYAKAGERGLAWGTRLKVAEAFERARRATADPARTKRGQRWEDLPRWRGSRDRKGLLAVQLQRGLPAEAAFGDDTRLQLDPLPPDAFDAERVPSRGARRRLQYTAVRLRIGSEGREPVWAEWPVWLHRPLPDGAVIKWACMVCRPWNKAVSPKRAMRYRWELHLTIEVQPVPQRVTDFADARVVAVNRGWRKMPDGSLRVATWVDSEGQTGELRLPYEGFRARLEKAQRIQGHRDDNRNALRDRLVSLGVPCARWKRAERFLRLLRESDSSDVKAHLTAWADRDEHLRRYQRGLREGAIGYRRDAYRRLAKFLTEKYDVVVVDDYGVKDIAEDPDRKKAPSSQRVQGAPHSLALALSSAAQQRGCVYVRGDTLLATQQCHRCGCADEWDAAREVTHTCEGCGETWDQDVNHCKNLLARARVQLAKPGALAPEKPKRRPRFAKRHKRNQHAEV